MGEKTTLNTCPGGGCHGGCILSTHVSDGKIVKVGKLVYPDGKKGTICLKGVAGGRLPYHPDRLRYPLKRTGKRGEGKWERISWEQALDEIADKIKDLRKKYNPESVAIIPMWNGTIPMNGTQEILGMRLRNLMQATDLAQGVPVDCNPFFATYFNFGCTMSGIFTDARVLVEGNTKYIIAWATNTAEMYARSMEYVNEARKKGAKFVDIGLMFDPTAKEADWWIPVKAGSDTALALGMMYVIINEKLYDEGYITKYTNGPFLVRTDNGKLLRESDVVPGSTSQNYVVWDRVNCQPKSIAPRTYEFSGVEPALLGTYGPNKIECKPVFQMLTDLANEYVPEKVHQITGVSSQTIEKLAREYATTKPATILMGFGMRYKNSGNAYRAIYTLGAIVGNIGLKGAGVVVGMTQGGYLYPQFGGNDLSIMFPTEARPRSIPWAHFFQCMIDGKPYPIKALLIYGTNLFQSFPNRRRWIEKVQPNLELIVVDEIFMTATAEYADYVLPDCTIFEREDIDIGHHGEIVLVEKAIEPMYECRPPIYFWSELGRRLGFGEYFDKTIEEWIEFRLKSVVTPAAWKEPPLTLERLKKEKIVRAKVPIETRQPFLDKTFPSPSGRMEIYSEELVPAGDGLPVFREQLESPRSDLVKKYPLVFNTANNKYFVHTMFANDPVVLKSYKTEPHISMNPRDAKERNINDGDTVIAYNDRGNCKVKAMTSEVVPPGVVNLPHGWWPKQFIEGHLTDLLLPLASHETRDEAREIFWSVVAERAGLKALAFSDFGDSFFAYSPDVYFDCLCEIKKAEVEE